MIVRISKNVVVKTNVEGSKAFYDWEGSIIIFFYLYIYIYIYLDFKTYFVLPFAADSLFLTIDFDS